MTKLKQILALVLTLVTFCSGSIVVSASPDPVDAQPPDTISADREIQPETPKIVDIAPDTSYEEAESEAEAAAPSLDSESVEAEESRNEEEPPARKKSGNTPYYVGAVVAVLLFIGVALYCKFNGGGVR